MTCTTCEKGTCTRTCDVLRSVLYACARCAHHATPDLSAACLHWTETHATDLQKRTRGKLMVELDYFCRTCGFRSASAADALRHQIEEHHVRSSQWKNTIPVRGVAMKRFMDAVSTTSPSREREYIRKADVLKTAMGDNYAAAKSSIALYEEALTVGVELGKRGEYSASTKPVPGLLVRKQSKDAAVDMAAMRAENVAWTATAVIRRSVHISSAAGDILLWATQTLGKCHGSGMPGMPRGCLIYVRDKDMWYRYAQTHALSAQSSASYVYWDPDPGLAELANEVHDVALTKIGEAFGNLCLSLDIEQELRGHDKEAAKLLIAASRGLLATAESISDSFLLACRLCEVLRERCAVTLSQLAQLGKKSGMTHYLDDTHEGMNKAFRKARKIKRRALQDGDAPARAMESCTEYLGFVISRHQQLLLLSPAIASMRRESENRTVAMYTMRGLESALRRVRGRYP